MPKKTLGLILILAIITIGLVVLALRSSMSDQRQYQVSPTEKPTVKTARLFFETNQIAISTLSKNATEVPVMIDSGEAKVSGAEVNLQYDPTIFSSVEFVPASNSAFFDYPDSTTILANTVDITAGRVSYVVSITPNSDAKTGSGQIGILKLQAAATAQPTNTTIVFSPDSAVTSLNADDSILQSASPLQVSIIRTQPTITPRIPTQTGTQSGAFR